MLLRNSQRLLRIGLAVFGFAILVHALEHLEISVLRECVSTCDQSHATSDDDTSSHAGHQHGCSPHEHSPAVLQAAASTPPDRVAPASPPPAALPPPSEPRKIDLPPRIS